MTIVPNIRRLDGKKRHNTTVTGKTFMATLVSLCKGVFNASQYGCVQMQRCGNFGQPGGLHKIYLFECQDIAIKCTCQVL